MYSALLVAGFRGGPNRCEVSGQQILSLMGLKLQETSISRTVKRSVGACAAAGPMGRELGRLV